MSIAEQMLNNANEAMKLTRKFFVVELDFSTGSVKQLEGLFDDVDFTLRGGKSPENVELLTRVWGSYLGEVIRRNAGGEWVEPTEGSFLLRCENGDLDPFEQVRQRLTAGPEHNVWQFYEAASGG